MSLGTTLLLGLIAGATIVLGLPVGRLQNPRPVLRLMLNAVAIGVLLFLVWDVLSAAWEPVDGALSAMHDDTGGAGPVAGYGALFVGGLAVGLVGLVGWDVYLKRAAHNRGRGGPGAMSIEETPAAARGPATWTAGMRTALLIAIGIGLHNFAEGLAIGQSAARGEAALATVLVVGFALHNATEGFGIVAPLAGDPDSAHVVPSWRFLLAMAAIGGGPTFVGTWVGHGFTSDAVSVVFLSLAAGSIIYVVLQLVGVAARARRMDVLVVGVLIGLLAGFLTDAIVTAGGV